MEISFSIHAIKRMFERRITKNEIHHVLISGDMIENYPDDTPYPSRLMFGWNNDRPLHVVVADNITDDQWIVITVYEPNLNVWESDYKRRK